MPNHPDMEAALALAEYLESDAREPKYRDFYLAEARRLRQRIAYQKEFDAMGEEVTA